MINSYLYTENGNLHSGFDYTVTKVSDNLSYLIFYFLFYEINVCSYLLSQFAIGYLLVIGSSHTKIYRINC